MPDQAALLQRLADGRFHSGTDLARRLGCSRSAVWKHVERLRKDLGLEVHAVTGRGYRLARPLERLQRAQILEGLAFARAQRLACEVKDVVPSTNALALDAARWRPAEPMAWFAEMQTEGRGRRGRQWHSPYGQNLYFSLLYPFDAPLQALSGLSIAVGVELAEWLSGCGLKEHGLKWPNDILWRQGKLAGILVEASGEAQGPACAVIGIGINIEPGPRPDWLDQPVACLRDAGVRLSRNRLAAGLLDRTLAACETFADRGLAPFIGRWPQYDIARGREVRLEGPSSSHTGTALGVSPDGGLILRLADGERIFHAGEVSLRMGEADA